MAKTNACSLNKVLDKVSPDGVIKYSEVGRMREDYQPRQEADKFMIRAFRTPGMSNFLDNFKDYQGILTKACNINGNHDFAVKMQNALKGYVRYNSADPTCRLKARKLEGDQDWDEGLNPKERQFVVDLYGALNDFSLAWDSSGNNNLAAIIQDNINNVLVNQTLGTIRNERHWSTLGQFFALASATGQGKNNLMGLLGILDYMGDGAPETTVYDHNGNSVGLKLIDLYSDDDDVMINAINLLFANNGNPPTNINYRTSIYRNSIKTLMKATEVDSFSRGLNSILQLSAIGKLTSYTAGMFTRIGGAMMGLTCFFTGWLNMLSYKKKNSDTKLHGVLNKFGLSGEYFSFSSNPADWLAQRWNYFWNSMSSDVRKGDISDVTREKTLGNVTADFFRKGGINFDRLSFLLMGVANIFGDTVFRGEYQLIAMDMAMQKLGITGDIESFLLKQTTYVDENGNTQVKYEMDEEAFSLLMTTFIEKLADVTGFPQIEGGGQSPLYWDTKGMTGLAKFAVNVGINAPLKMWHWMTGWGTAYVNNTYRILSGGIINLFRKKPSYDDLIKKNYTGPGGKRAITQYTRMLEKDGVSMPWEVAQSLVSKQEFATEVSRLLAGIRNAYRLGNLACRNDDGIVDWRCAFKNFAGAVYLPWQAIESSAHPLIRSVTKMATDCYEKLNYFGEHPETGVSAKDVFTESMMTNFLKPLLRSMYVSKVFSQAALDTWNDDYNEDDFIDNLMEIYLDSTDNFMYYISDELSSYVYSTGAYGPKNYLSSEFDVFGAPNELRDLSGKITKIKSVERVHNDGVFQKLFDMSPTLKLIFGGEEGRDVTSLNESNIVDKFIHDYLHDEGVLSLLDGQFTPEMKNDYDFMQYTWNNLTSDWESYGANFKEGVRDNKYNKSEVEYFEFLLGDEIKKAKGEMPGASDLQIYDKALKTFFAGTPTYDQIKQAIQIYDDAGESAYGAYTDYLANAHWLMETTGVKGLALVAEYRKRMYMEDLGLYYSNSNTVADKNRIKSIENIVAGELGEYLYLADRRQYANLTSRRFLQNHPEYEKTSALKNLVKDGEWNLNGDVNLNSQLGTAIWANNLAKTELATGNVNGYELVNVFTEKFGSPFDKEGNFDNEKAAQYTALVSMLDEGLEDAGKTQLERSLILAPILTKNLDMWTHILSSKSKEADDLRARLGEDIIGNVRNLLYDTYTDLSQIDELLSDHLNNRDVIDTILGKTSKHYKNGGSLYYGKTSSKDYDYYRTPADAFKAWGSKNLSKFANSYGKGRTSYAGNYSTREFAFLNQRAHRNPISSMRIAPDIPFAVGGFSQPTVKSKNPVSGYTTNIKPWAERPTAKFGKSKGIVGGSGSRGPVTNFKA